MNCVRCTKKTCKTDGQDCNGRHNEIAAEYGSSEIADIYSKADMLVSNGRAGSLSRIEEIIEFSKSMDYEHICLAYCFSMEQWAGEMHDILKKEGFKVSSVRCTINGIREKEIDPDLTNSVNCNPIGQARAINDSGTDLVIEMGLCLGHDILFHQHLTKPFTVLFVKDRKYGHIPQKYFDA